MISAGRLAPLSSYGLALCAALALLTSPARDATAIDAFDGRLQLHGFGEVQMRALSSQFREELDLAQWYNVLNLELELDIAPDGFGPVNLLEAYVRVEGRYDCVWTRGCGTMRSANTYGDRAERLPRRLRNAVDDDYSGVIPPTPPNHPVRRIQDQAPANLTPLAPEPDTTGIFGARGRLQVLDRQGLPGFDTLFDQRGADDQLGTPDDPAIYTFGRYMTDGNPYMWALADFEGAPGTARTMLIGPWRPENFVESVAALKDRANPFRGGFTPFGGYRGSDPLDPRLAQLKLDIIEADSQGFDANPSSPGIQTAAGLVPSLVTARPDDLTGDSFAGDWSGIVPCQDPISDPAARQISGQEFSLGCFPNLPRDPDTLEIDVATGESILELGRNVRIQQTTRGFVQLAGVGELPLRPAPDLSNLATDEENPRNLLAQGLYVPSPGLVRELEKGRFDDPDVNFRQSERAWNRGQSQQDEKELKEAYVDIEWLDSRLWTRIGKQNIVWGKTELFRTTDQFNPQDLALASLPSLEESRIALWAARFVYSLYNVGPLEDVRAEFAFNFDQYQPADLGACGEPFTPDAACGIPTGLFFHSVTGVGLAGIDRPENPWNSVKGLEVGGRIEWRWDRFSFALTDFYGYNDFPYIDRIFTYERNASVMTGRPLIAEIADTSACATPSAGTSANLAEFGTAPGDIGLNPERPFNDPKNPLAMTQLGIGIDPACLKGGGAPGFDNENLLGGAENALQFSPSNQQLFAWICSGTIGIAASLDPGSCAWNVFDSPVNPTGGLVLNVAPLIEIISNGTAGDGSPETRAALRLVANNTKTEQGNTMFGAFSLNIPLSALNRDPGPDGFVGEFWDGVITASNPTINRHNADADPLRYTITVGGVAQTYQPVTFNPTSFATDCDDPGSQGPAGPQQISFPAGGFTQLFAITIPNGACSFLRFHHDPGDGMTLDSALSSFQKALLGCGPFYGTRCDSSDRVFFLDPTVSYASLAEARAAVEQLYREGGGIDFLNTEASALIQSFPGVEGTAPLGDAAEGEVFWTVIGQRPQPGTAPVDDPAGLLGAFEGGPACTRPDGQGGLVVLPGCRGIELIRVGRDAGGIVNSIQVSFEDGYEPRIDGCVIATDIGSVPVQVVANESGYIPPAAQLNECATTSTRRQFLANAMGQLTDPLFVAGMDNFGAGTLWHPLAGCTSEEFAMMASAQSDCGGTDQGFLTRFIMNPCTLNAAEDCLAIEEEFLGLVPGRTAQIFKSEMAAFSYNFLSFLVITSCNIRDGDTIPGVEPGPGELPPGPQECFNPQQPLRANKCSFNAPHLCQNVKGFLAVAGVTRQDVRAGGNGRFGRRTFIWHSGGEIALRYEKRNVFGFSMDFAEDVTKSNFGIEFTWIEGLPFVNNDSYSNMTRSDTLNLTVSVDRPTFINFLNPNRTFFINSQWFFQYVTDYHKGFTSNGPINVLFTVAAFTGYFQDRLLPTFVSVYDFNSRSGGFLPSITYRFTEAFSATVGMNLFFGRTERVRMPVNEIAPVSNRAPNAKGEDAYRDGADNLLSLIRKRDEVYLRLRWTF